MDSNFYSKYPHLRFVKQWNLTAETWLILGQCEAYVSAIDNTPILPSHYVSLMQLSLLKGAQATTAIEGNTLSEAEIQQIMDNQKLPPSKEYQEIEVKNILSAFNELLQEIVTDNVPQFITPDLIMRFNKMVGKDLGEHFAAIPGRLRNSEVRVGRYRAPDYEAAPALLEEFCKWLTQEFGFCLDRHQSFANIVLQAIISHIYIEWIHPFGDGNGRTGRLLEFYILLRGGVPDIASHILCNYYNQTRTKYYLEIEKATRQCDLTSFIEYALLGFRDGLAQTLDVIQQSQWQNTWQRLVYDKFEGIRRNSHIDVFRRQRTFALEIFGINKSFTCSQVAVLTTLLAKLYSSIAPSTIARDVKKLEELKLLRKDGNGFAANTGILRGMAAKRRII